MTATSTNVIYAPLRACRYVAWRFGKYHARLGSIEGHGVALMRMIGEIAGLRLSHAARTPRAHTRTAVRLRRHQRRLPESGGPIIMISRWPPVTGRSTRDLRLAAVKAANIIEWQTAASASMSAALPQAPMVRLSQDELRWIETSVHLGLQPGGIQQPVKADHRLALLKYRYARLALAQAAIEPDREVAHDIAVDRPARADDAVDMRAQASTIDAA